MCAGSQVSAVSLADEVAVEGQHLIDQSTGLVAVVQDESVDAGVGGLVAALDSIGPGEYEERLTLVAVDMKRRPIASSSMAEQEAECSISRCRCGEHAPTSARRRLAVAGVHDESR